MQCVFKEFMNYKTCAFIRVQKGNFVVKWQQYYPNKPMWTSQFHCLHICNKQNVQGPIFISGKATEDS